MARTKAVLKNVRDGVLNITDNDTAITSTIKTNGLEITNFFENVDNSGTLVINNASAASFVVTVEANEDNVAGALGDYAITVATGKQVAIILDDSSRFGQICIDSDGKTHLGLFLAFNTGSASSHLLVAMGKTPQGYTAPNIA